MENQSTMMREDQSLFAAERVELRVRADFELHGRNARARERDLQPSAARMMFAIPVMPARFGW